ncbi:vacuolar sorting-associated protein Vps27 [Mycena maculata]|uniref:Vacuolar protein sorting-associated protein 27 n=1 Tax=Mycena maculata TaxID=230809 RepID=A0AAD7HQC7_9AGAR|nr:vacuolar sorting-associated protein Vps27 [Mycena maculata]
MSSLGSWLWGVSQLDEAVDKATSELLPAGAEDIALNLEICDQIRSKSVPAKDAMRALKRRLNHKNPNVQNLALGLTDICIKNGGDLFLAEVASREFMDNLVSILKIPVLNIDVKNNILRLVQNWSIAFEGKPALSYVGQVYKTLTSEGFKFPPKDLAVANSAMVDTQTAPDWIDSDVCLRCRTAFSFTNRKHHCRNCGQVFDQQCSSKSIPLPHFGITQDVRVCDSCYPKITKKGERSDKGHRHSTSLHGTRHRAARELADAELQRAIQLSLQEVGAANGRARPGYTPYQPEPTSWQYTEPPLVDRSTHPKPQASEEDDPDLRAAIEASLRESNAPRPSAPMAIETPRTEEQGFAYNNGPGYSQSYPPGIIPPQPVARVPSYDLEPLESDAILTFSQTVEQVQGQGGRDMARYPAVNELYDKANSLRPKLALSLDDTGRKEQMLSDMHDKLSQAVKLYDQLLTEQVVHPRWRSPQPVANPSYQQANSSYSTGYNTVNGYNQWQAQPAPAEAPPQPQQQQQYAPRPESVQPQWFPEQPQYAEPQHQQPQYVPPPPTQQYSPTPSAPPPPQFAPQAAPAQPQYQPGPSQTLPPVSYAPQPQSQPSAPSFQQQQLTYAQSPPPQQQYTSPPSTSHLPPQSHSSTLSRHNTVAYSSSSSPTVDSAYLARSNTLSHLAAQRQQVPPQHAPRPQHQPPQPQAQQQQPPQQQYQHPAQQQPQYVSSPPPTLPAFPVAPTSAPQSFPMYAPSMIPTGVPQTERKEALLIDL